MMNIRGARKKWIILIAALFLMCWWIAGCMLMHRQPDTSDSRQPDQISVLANKNRALQQELDTSNAELQNLEKDFSNLKTQVLGYEALIKDLRHRGDVQQQRLDAAIIEVVRAKAKLRSLGSKAEAASTLAEAEIAVKALKGRAASAGEIAMKEIATADQLLDMSRKEFNARNFGGALYLANQAKSQIRAVQIRLGKRFCGPIREGESFFAQPLALKIVKDCNLRAGPGLNEKIIGKLNEGAEIIGDSYKESWIHVETREGLNGWVFQPLIGVP
jgi:hypothetical protein